MGEPRILIVDDEPDMVDNCARILRRAGHRCLTATDPHRALTLLESNGRTSPDGSQDARDRRSRPAAAGSRARSRPTVVVITAFATIEVGRRGRQGRRLRYLPKTFSLDQLTIVVDRALRQRRLALENRNLREQLQTTFGLENVSVAPRDGPGVRAGQEGGALRGQHPHPGRIGHGQGAHREGRACQ
jgi:DNA-binding NtrC family response regulator